MEERGKMNGKKEEENENKNEIERARQENNIEHSKHWRLQSAVERKKSDSFVAGCSIHMAKVCNGSWKGTISAPAENKNGKKIC